MSRCAVKDCQLPIPDDKAFCRTHWNRLSDAQRTEIYESHRKFLRGVRTIAAHVRVVDRIALELSQPGLGL